MENRFPKNVRQIGNVSDTPKIYVEDYVDTFLNQLCDTHVEEPVGAFLVGKRVRQEEKDCIYISGAIRMEKVDIVGPDIAISDETWEQAEAERQKYFEQSFVGWCICIPGQPLRLSSNLNKIHEQIFGTEGSVLVIKAARQKEEVFYVHKYRELMQLGGHFIYYEKNPEMQDYMIMSRKKIGVTPSEAVEDQAAKDFRNLIREKASYQEQRKASQFLYIASTFLVLVVIAMGVTMMNNYDKMKAVQTSVEYIKESVAEEKKESVEEIIEEQVEEEAETEDVREEVAEVESEDEEIVSTMQEMSEDIYIVEKGDTLARISLKIYGDVGHVDAICRMNGLSDGNLIFIGQKLLLP